MAYKIPKNLTKYSETFLWGFTFKQFFYLLGLSFVLYLIISKLNTLVLLKILLIIPVVLLGFLLIYGKIDEKVMKKLQLKGSLRKVGYYDPRIDSFIPLREIVDDIVLLKSGKMLAVLEILPIDFEIMSEVEQESVLSTYNNWLRSLDYEVQITSRSVDLTLTQWLSTVENTITEDNKERYTIFKKWVNDLVNEEKVRNRIFYIIIPLHVQLKSKKSFLKSISNWISAAPVKSIDRDDPSYKKALKDLEVRVQMCIETLKASQIKIRRLKSEELLGLYSSYFTNVSGGGKSYLTPVMWAGGKNYG
jgi:hypothetical protein